MNKANDMINKFLSAGGKFTPELHLVDPIVKKYSACGPFTKHTKIFFKYRQIKLYLQK